MNIRISFKLGIMDPPIEHNYLVPVFGINIFSSKKKREGKSLTLLAFWLLLVFIVVVVITKSFNSSCCGQPSFRSKFQD